MRRVSQSASQRKDGNFTVKLVAKNILVKGKEKNWSPIRIRSSSLQREDRRSSSHAASFFKIYWWICTAIPWMDLELQGMVLLTNYPSTIISTSIYTLYGLIISLMLKNLDLSE